MFSMTATAPESIQQRRRASRENSPQVTPTKNQSPPVIPYGQHSPLFPVQRTNNRHVRRYSAGTDATTALVSDLPPIMPLDIIGKGEVIVSEGHIEIAEENVLTTPVIFRDSGVSGGAAAITSIGDQYRAKLDIEQKCSSMSLEDKEDRQPLEFCANSSAAASAAENEKTVLSPLHAPTFSEDENNQIDMDGNASDDDVSEGNEYFDRCRDAERPTEQSLNQLEKISNNNTLDGLAPQNSQYKRSPSMEPLFDSTINNTKEKPNNKRSFLILKTVCSTDNEDLAKGSGPPEVVPMCPSYEEHTSIYKSVTRDDVETSSSTNGVFIDEGAVNEIRSFKRSISMQPIFDRDSSERLSSAEPAAFDENQMSPVEEMSPDSAAGARKRFSNPSSPIVYTLSGQPTSPLLSDINTEINQAENDAFGRVCAQLTGVSLSHDSASDIGGDTYFDQSISDIGGDTYFDKYPDDDDDDDATKEVKRRFAAAAAQLDRDEELTQPIALPPRVKRTTTDPEAEEQNVTLDFPLTSSRLVQNQAMIPGIPPLPVRNNFDNTHSLLDDCSDEEDDITSLNMDDSPTRHIQSYSCFPKKHSSNHSGPYVSYLNVKKQKPNSKAPHPANTAVDNSIQRALLETRHRRWSCQSAFAGSHAQSDQVFDVSNRVHYITIHENQLNLSYTRNGDIQFIEDELSDCTDDGLTISLARISVSHAAIRAGALACGLWRTVRLVCLPKGLFEKHWLMWREKKHSFEEVYDENDIWALLQMLRETFPLLDQVDFGGDTLEELDDSSSDHAMRKEWKNEIISRVLQILPNLTAIDGFDATKRVTDVAVPCSPHAEFVTLKKETATDQAVPSQQGGINLEDVDAICVQDAKSSVACEIFEPVDVQMCGWTHLVDTQAQAIQEVFSFDNNTAPSESVEVEAIGSFAAPEQCSVAQDISSDAIEDVSQNIMSMIEGCVGPKQKKKEACTLKLVYSPATLLETDGTNDDLNADTDQMLVSPISSKSWETNNNSRPPICPVSSTHQRRIPKLPLERKKSKGSEFKARFKRRVLGLIPSTSVMDEDDDSDGEESEHIGECPTDLL